MRLGNFQTPDGTICTVTMSNTKMLTFFTDGDAYPTLQFAFDEQRNDLFQQVTDVINSMNEELDYVRI